jgi:hypothetical protein
MFNKFMNSSSFEMFTYSSTIYKTLPSCQLFLFLIKIPNYQLKGKIVWLIFICYTSATITQKQTPISVPPLNHSVFVSEITSTVYSECSLLGFFQGSMHVTSDEDDTKQWKCITKIIQVGLGKTKSNKEMP